MSALGDFIRECREVRRITLRQFAAHIGISAMFLSDIEHGRRWPSDATLDLLARALDTDAAELRKLDDRLPPTVENRIAALERRVKNLESRPYNPAANLVMR